MAENHECCRAALAYAEMVDHWFHSVKAYEEDEEEDPTAGGLMEMQRFGPFDRDHDLKESVEVIRWYQYQIYIKLMRAVRGRMEERVEMLDGFPKDSDGSAKVALIGMDRSIAAWGELGDICLLENQALLDILVHLERLRRRVEETFPEARDFIRPGFDRVNLNG